MYLIPATILFLSQTISLELIGMETHSCLARVELWSLYSPLRPAGDAVILHLRYLFCACKCGCMCTCIFCLTLFVTLTLHAIKLISVFGCMKAHTTGLHFSPFQVVCNCCLTRCGAEPLSKNQCDDLAGANGCETTLGGKHALLSPAGLLPALWLHANQCSPPETCL